MTAPVCPVSRSQPVSPQAGIFLPYVTPAVDLPSALRAINQLQNVIQMLTTGKPANNVPFSLGVGRTSGGLAGAGGAYGGLQARNWVEDVKRRTTRIDRVYMNDDSSSDTWIDFKRLVHMEMHDVLSGDKLIWDFGA